LKPCSSLRYVEYVPVSVVVADVSAPTLVSAASTRRHGTRGTFDLPVSLDGSVTVEPRRGGVSALKLVFSEPVGAADGLLDASEFNLSGATFRSVDAEAAPGGAFVVTLSLVGAANGGLLTVSLSGLSDAAGNALAGDRDVTVRSRFGDVDGSGRVDAADTMLVRAGLTGRRGAWNYLLDLDLSGAINAVDLAYVRRYAALSAAGL